MKNNKSVTAVEWLIKEIQNRQNGIVDTLPVLSTDELYVKAKQMEKEQIIKAYNQDLYGGLRGEKQFNDGEQYYNETFKQQKP